MMAWNIETISTVVVAASALVSAAATVVLTFLSVSGWRLYELERSSRNQKVGRLAALITREFAEMDTAHGEIAGDVPADIEEFHAAVRAMPARRNWVQQRRFALNSL